MEPASAWRRLARAAAALAASALCAAPVRAQLSASLTVESDYRFRGVSLSASRPSVQALVNVDGAAGWYVGASATRVEPARGDRYLQVLGYAGYARALAAGYSLEIGASYAHFTGESRYDFIEPYVGLLWRNAALRLHYAPDYFGAKVRTAYLDASGQLPLSERLRLFGHLGVLLPLSRRAEADDEADKSRADLRLGAGLVLGRWDLRLAWVAVGPGGPYPAVYGGSRQGWSLAVSTSF